MLENLNLKDWEKKKEKKNNNEKQELFIFLDFNIGVFRTISCLEKRRV